MKMNRVFLGSAALALTLTPAQLSAQDDLQGQIMYAVDRETSELMRYDFAGNSHKSVGLIRSLDGKVFAGGIDAMAYAHGTETMPAYTHLFAFRWDEASHKSQMLWVDVRTATAEVGNGDLEGGVVGGATAVFHNNKWNVYAVQHELVSPPFGIKGTIANINPNNSNQMSFELVAADGKVIERADLLNATLDDLDANRNLFVGEATQIRIRPKGNGNNNSLTITHPGQAPQVMELRNSNTYVFTGTMNVRLYNVSNNGHAMGHWWLEVDGSAYLNGDVEILSPHRIVHVAHAPDAVSGVSIGTVTELATLSRPYDSLSSVDGSVFYATHGNELWRIEPGASQVETLVTGSVANSNAKLLGMEFADSDLFSYEKQAGAVHLLELINGTKEASHAGFSNTNYGSILFCPIDRDRHFEALAYD